VLGPGRYARRARPSSASMLKLDCRVVFRRAPASGAQTSMLTWKLPDGWESSVSYSIVRDGILKPSPNEPGGQSWAMRLGHGELTLEYRMDGESRLQRLRLVATFCHLGGRRWWVICPCGRRAAVLWGPEFRCRRCHGLAYATAQASKRDRPQMRARKLHARLGAAQSPETWWVPGKPLRMHWNSYRRMVDELRRQARNELALLPSSFRGMAAVALESSVMASEADSPRETRRRKYAESRHRARLPPKGAAASKAPKAATPTM
jgi:hypothetical protein